MPWRLCRNLLVWGCKQVLDFKIKKSRPLTECINRPALSVMNIVLYRNCSSSRADILTSAMIRSNDRTRLVDLFSHWLLKQHLRKMSFRFLRWLCRPQNRSTCCRAAHRCNKNIFLRSYFRSATRAGERESLLLACHDAESLFSLLIAAKRFNIFSCIAPSFVFHHCASDKEKWPQPFLYQRFPWHRCMQESTPVKNLWLFFLNYPFFFLSHSFCFSLSLSHSFSENFAFRKPCSGRTRAIKNFVLLRVRECWVGTTYWTTVGRFDRQMSFCCITSD